MFPTEIQLEMHREEMRRAAENHRLVKFIREEDAQPTLLQRLRTHLSAPRTEAVAVEIQGSVTSRSSEAIA